MTKQIKLGIERLENKQLLSVVPNDPLINEQWGLSSTSAYQAWEWGTGSKNVVVAILDSGIDTNHPDLKDNLWINNGEIPNNGLDDEGNGYVDDIHGWNFVNNNNNIQDNFGHGTHVAGIIGGKSNNNLGISGVNWNVSLMVLKFIDDNGVGWTSGVLKAIDYMLKMKNEYGVNIVVANNSWSSGSNYSSVLDNKIDLLNNSNIMFVVAAGNQTKDLDIYPSYPASYVKPNMISVASLTSYNSISFSSNYGDNSVDLLAPGSAIKSTYKNGSYAYLSGTSMASPFVSGAVALMSSIDSNQTISQIKDILLSTVDLIGAAMNKVISAGKLNIGAAVSKMLQVPYEFNIVPIGSITSINLKTITGWVMDYNYAGGSPVRLLVNGLDYAEMLTGVGGVFSFNISKLPVGEYNLEVLAKDMNTGSWVNIGRTNLVVPAPVVRVGLLSLSRIAGWAHSQKTGASPVVVRVVINGKLVATQWANLYRPALISIVGSVNHGFNVKLNPWWFRKGTNDIRIQVFDPISKQITLVWVGKIRK